MNSFSVSTRLRLDKYDDQISASLLGVLRSVRAAAKNAGLDPLLTELVNIRCSQLNSCASCLDAHVRTALKRGEPHQRLAVLPAWRESDLYSLREKAALELAELVTQMPGEQVADEAYARAREQLTEIELGAIIWIAITINTFNRVYRLGGHPLGPSDY